MKSPGLRALVWVILAASVSACEYRETVGRTSETTSECDGSSCQVPGDCSTFEIPSGDCTLGQPACNFASDCPGVDSSCNLMTRRCFTDTDRCVGTPCGFSEDCPSSERCNQTAGVCYDLSADQTCMPCFLASTDCGQQICDSDLEHCK